jgi:hypothetical protein
LGVTTRRVNALAFAAKNKLDEERTIVGRDQLHAERRSCGADHRPLSDVGLTFKFTHDTDARDLRRDLSQQLKPVGAQGKIRTG